MRKSAHRDLSTTGKEKVLELPGGRTIFIGGLKATVTNGITGTTVTLPLGGGVQVNNLPNGGAEVVFTGRNVGGDPDAGSLELLRGRFSTVIDADGRMVQAMEGNGQRTEICALLA